MKSTVPQTLNSISELNAYVRKCLPVLFKPKQIILLNGEMGSGKTEFVKQILSLLGDHLATSPSFAIHNSYQATYNGVELAIEHLDLYRLNSEEDLQSVGFWDLFENEQAIVIVEWASKLELSRLPRSWGQLVFEFKTINDSTRSIHFEMNIVK